MLRKRGYLLESRQVVIDLNGFLRDFKEYVSGIVDSSKRTYERYQAGDPDIVSRYKRYGHEPSLYTWDEAKRDIADRVRNTKKNMQVIGAKIMRAVSAIGDTWSSPIIAIKPNYTYSDRGGYAEFSPDDAPDGANVELKRGTSRYQPGFTMFGDGTIDDVLDAADRDFFPANDPALESDYFLLVNELRSPGSAQKQKGKVLTLYTARPKTDRSRYEHAKTVPHGVFLTNSEDRAYRIGMDLAGSTGRDVYLVKIDDRFLIKTLDAGGIKEYQVVGRGKSEVPVLKIERVA